MSSNYLKYAFKSVTYLIHRDGWGGGGGNEVHTGGALSIVLCEEIISGQIKVNPSSRGYSNERTPCDEGTLSQNYVLIASYIKEP